MLKSNTKKLWEKSAFINKVNLRPDVKSGLSLTGFTFFELMVTVAILSFGIVIIFQGFLVSLSEFSY
jgi:hypothetical protein